MTTPTDPDRLVTTIRVVRAIERLADPERTTGIPFRPACLIGAAVADLLAHSELAEEDIVNRILATFDLARTPAPAVVH